MAMTGGINAQNVPVIHDFSAAASSVASAAASAAGATAAAASFTASTAFSPTAAASCPNKAGANMRPSISRTINDETENRLFICTFLVLFL